MKDHAMKIALDSAGVEELTRRFGDLHDSVIRRFSGDLTSPARVEIGLDALALDGTWWRLTLTLEDVSEFRLAEGAAIYANEKTYDMTTLHADGTATRETKMHKFGDLAYGAWSNTVIFASAIHVLPDVVFVDLSPIDLVDPSAERDPAAWRMSTFYVRGRRGEASFEPWIRSPPAPGDLRFEFLRYGATTMYFRRELFDAAISRLTDAGYRVHVVDASSAEAVRAEMTRVMRFEENFGYAPWGGNLDALNDAFSELDYEGAAGIVLAFVRYDLLHTEDPHMASTILDILEHASRDALLHGAQLIGLVQSDDPKLHFAPLGGRSPQWNPAEWGNSARGV